MHRKMHCHCAIQYKGSTLCCKCSKDFQLFGFCLLVTHSTITIRHPLILATPPETNIDPDKLMVGRCNFHQLGPVHVQGRASKLLGCFLFPMFSYLPPQQKPMGHHHHLPYSFATPRCHGHGVLRLHHIDTGTNLPRAS